MRKPAVFVSYDHAHKEEVRNLVRFLSIGKSPVFFDECIEPGEEWEKRLLSALNDAPTFVIFWCLHASESEWVKKELALAIQLRKRIVPVRLDQTEVPDGLAKYQWLQIQLCWTEEVPPERIHASYRKSDDIFPASEPLWASHIAAESEQLEFAEDLARYVRKLRDSDQPPL